MSGVDHFTERDPLLRSPDTNGQYGDGDQSNKDAAPTPGPLELPRSAHIGILAGIWLATFLSVRSVGKIPIHST